MPVDPANASFSACYASATATVAHGALCALALGYLVLPVRKPSRWDPLCRDMPLWKRTRHFMIQAEDVRHVGVAFERAKRGKLPISLNLGQHPRPDGTIFCGLTPCGFDVETGAGAREIEPWEWQALHTTTTSSHARPPCKLRKNRLRPTMTFRKNSRPGR